jgi:hypothetical protein
VANLRLVLDVVVSPGKVHSAGKARQGFRKILDKLPELQRPALAKGDCGFGNDLLIIELESRRQPYLFKLKQTLGVKKLLACQLERKDWSTPVPAGQGWSAVQNTLKLSGWDKARGGSSFCAEQRRPIWRSAAKSSVCKGHSRNWANRLSC